jgi:S-adenosylmethionine decarboxylase
MSLALPNVTTISNDAVAGDPAAYRDLAPMITRQRLVVEGYPTFVITDEHIKDYLSKLSVVTDMITLIEPVTHVSDLYGWAGWIHWETSGAHFYSWERPVSFFSVDIYTCKAFDPAKVVEFTEQYFRTTQIVAKGF